jgi:basic membrane protein A
MRLRSSGLALLAIAGLIAACAGPAASPRPGATGTPAGATEAPTQAPTLAATEEPTEAPTEAATEAPTSAATEEPTGAPATGSPTAGEFRVAVVTDVGTVNDKNFNEYSFVGASAGAAAIGADEPPVFVPPDASQYQAGIDAFIEQGYNVIVTVGFNLEAATAAAAKANPEIWFVGVDQNPCVDAEGNVDPTFANCTDVGTVLPQYILLQYQEDQAGYLVGIVAASISESDVIGAIGGITLCAPCIRYIQGYELGAQSVKPEIEVITAYVTESDFVLAFNDPVAGKNFGEQFIQQNSPDVLFQVAGKTGNGALEAACEAGIHGIGVDVDQWLSLDADNNPVYQCIVTSAEKKLARSVEETVVAISQGTAQGGQNLFNAANDGIGISPENSGAGLITPEIQAAIDTALQGMRDGTLQTCPETCGQLTE